MHTAAWQLRTRPGRPFTVVSVTLAAHRGNQNLHAVSSCFFLTLVRRVAASNLSGLPAVALPCLLSDGPPATSLWAGPPTPGPCGAYAPALASLSESWQPPASHTIPVFFPALFPQDT